MCLKRCCVFLVLLWGFGCTEDEEGGNNTSRRDLVSPTSDTQGNDLHNPDAPTCPDGSDYATAIEPMLREICLPCHSAALSGLARNGAPIGVNFDTEDDLRRHAENIRLWALEDQAMPPAPIGALSDCQQDALGAYLTALAEQPCTPDCTGRTCGHDGCGGACAPGCTASQTCNASGQCQDNCTPNCTNKDCGDDGCGGLCAPGCTAPETCTVENTCKCIRNCQGRVCGPDGCGDACGPGCSASQACDDPSGQCVCAPNCDGKSCGPDGCNGQCGPGCAVNQTCDASGQCVCAPNCAGKACGPDGCGGQCGSPCGPGLACDATGQCVCAPDCTGKDCGDNGCGGSCGDCTPPLVCQTQTGTCDTVCTADCTNRVCGPDGCGGACGAPCGPGLACDASGQCVCAPDCTGKDCGPDGCGGPCGTCPLNEACDASGQCVCVPDCAGKSCGPDGCGGECGTPCGPGLACDATGQCVCAPDCTDKVCGSDGCGGECGSCNPNEACDATGQCVCVPDCAGKVCGPDGCGSQCGSPCTGGLVCNSGICETPSFSRDVYPMLSASCAGCHSTYTSASNAYTGTVNINAGQCLPAVRKLVFPGNAANSYLIDKLKGTNLCAGSARMPRGGPYFSAANIAIIEAWINAGALND